MRHFTYMMRFSLFASAASFFSAVALATDYRVFIPPRVARRITAMSANDRHQPRIRHWITVTQLRINRMLSRAFNASQSGIGVFAMSC